jgi:hypothetical protein
MSEEQCKEMVSAHSLYGSFHQHQCNRNAWKDGYCKQHHPDTVAESRAKQSEERERKFKRQKREWRLQNAAPDLLTACKGVINMLHGEFPGHPMTEAVEAAILKAEGDK